MDHIASNISNLKVTRQEHTVKSDHKLVTTLLKVNRLNKANKRQFTKELRTKAMNPEEYADILNRTQWPDIPFIKAMKKKR